MENCEEDSLVKDIQSKQVIHPAAIVEKRPLNFLVSLPKKVFNRRPTDSHAITAFVKKSNLTHANHYMLFNNTKINFLMVFFMSLLFPFDWILLIFAQDMVNNSSGEQISRNSVTNFWQKTRNLKSGVVARNMLS